MDSSATIRPARGYYYRPPRVKPFITNHMPAADRLPKEDLLVSQDKSPSTFCQVVLTLGIAAAVAIVTNTAAAATASTGGPRPNILVILADDLGYADLGFQGCHDIPTPHLDGARGQRGPLHEWLRLGPLLQPHAGRLALGRYQERFGHEFNPGGQATGQENIGLPLSEITIADRLKAAGYATGLVGKWHLGSAAKFHPQQRGFQEFFGFLGGAHPYFPERDAAPIYRGTEQVTEKEYLTDAFAREAVAFIDRHQKAPFCLYLAFNAVHTPMHATDDRLKKFSSITDERRRTYAAMTSAMDDAVGRVLGKPARGGYHR